MDKTRKTIGENIKKAAQLRGIKQVEMARFLGVSQSSVSNWINGTNSVDIDTLAKLCDFLGVSLNQIAGLEVLDTQEVVTGRELKLLISYRALNEEEKKQVDDFIRFVWLNHKEAEKIKNAAV